MRIELWMALERVARRMRGVRLWGWLSLCWISWAAVAAMAYSTFAAPESAVGPSQALLVAVGVGALASALLCGVRAMRSARDPLWVARQIESRHPELSSVLLAATEQAATPPGKLGFLQTAVINKALEHDRRNPWEEMVAVWKLVGLQIAHIGALALFLVAFGALVVQARTARSESGATVAHGSESADFDVKIEPGNTELERGSSLLVVARFGKSIPADVTLVTEGASQGAVTKPMSRSLEDPAFAGRVQDVDADLSYHVDYDGVHSETFRVKVFEYPAVERVDAQLSYPAFTGLESKIIEDIRHVTAVEGTELTLIVRLNKPVATALFADAKHGDLPLEAADDDARVVRTTFKLVESRRLSVQLVDRDGRKNKNAVELAIKVTPNRPPTITMKRPTSDVQVSPLEELELLAELEDDFGVVRQGLQYTTAAGESHETIIAGDASPAKKVEAGHLLDFEGLQSEPDQLVTYHYWAEDIGPDGQPRRTLGDLYFAEVRPFEEIFREGEQPTSGEQQQQQQQGGGAAEAAAELAELQKQIVSGTWKLIRREVGELPSAEFAADSKLLVESQQAAIEQAGELAQELQDPKSMEAMAQAVKAMGAAFERLQISHETASPGEQRLALAPEQAAYQALLKLRAREFEVTRGAPGSQAAGSASGSGNRSERQLDELELSSDENRYETQSSAQSQQQNERQQQQRETRQVLNRLRELAQRQTDLNERLQEMQSALQAAQTEEQRAEVERQLKRLREQQQQILRDTDELQARLDQEQNRERMAGAREQLQQTRDNVRDASEALEAGQLSEAITEGTRAERELSELRDRVRESASDQFTEEMTEMRDEARQLDERQRRLAEQMDAMNRRQEQQTLRDGGEREQAREGLQGQRERLEQLLDRMRSTVQEAEQTEPLLAEELFETVQGASERRIDEALDITDRLLEAGIPREARQVAQQAGEGIREVREGVERAAENVLPDEAEALRRADRELNELAEQLNREIVPENERATDSPPSDRNPAQDPSASPPNAEATSPDAGERPGAGPPSNGQQNPGEPSPGLQDQPGSQGQGSEEEPSGQAGENQGQGSPSPSATQGAGEQGENPPNDSPGQEGQGQQEGNEPNRSGERGAGGNRQASFEEFLERSDGGPGGPGGPITGEGFREWSDRMREVEELIEDPELRSEAARIRDRVRGEREEFKRHAKEPDPTKLRDLIAEPLMELRTRIREELRRRENPDALVPIDRDPVPPQFSEGVRRYYERLGSGQ